MYICICLYIYICIHSIINIYKYVYLLYVSMCLVTQSCLTVLTPWTVAHQASLSRGFFRQEHWSELPCPPPGILPNPGIEPRSQALQVDSLPSEPPGRPYISISNLYLYHLYLYLSIYSYTRSFSSYQGESGPYPKVILHDNYEHWSRKQTIWFVWFESWPLSFPSCVML